MSTLETFAHEQLKEIRSRKLYRELRTVQSATGVELRSENSPLISFASNDYLGLANHPKVKAAAQQAIDQFGVGAGASRLITGTQFPHQRLEEQLADFKGTEAALAFNTGYQTAIGTITSILKRGDVVFSDELNHACLIDGIRLSRAEVKIFKHNDLDHLESLLKESANNANHHNRLIVTESVFSMDGDLAPLPQLVELKQRFETWLMIDEAHATGLFGQKRSGRAEESGLTEEIDIHMGTLGKALGSAGGYICGSRSLRDLLINRARSFIFSTAPTPATAAAARAAIEVVQSSEGEERSTTLRQRIDELTAALPHRSPSVSPIIPYLVGDAAKSVEVSLALKDQGLLVPAIRYPTVPLGTARLRIALSAQHTSAHIQHLAHALNRLEHS